jgi:beta-barrel assembly-enhancing protease
MRDRVLTAAVLALLTATMLMAHRQRIDAPVGAQSVLYLVADSERELSRLPAKFTRISDKDEIEAGNRIVAPSLNGDGLTPADREIEAYVRQVGARIALGAQRKLPYQFHYIADRNFINAFALPGGHVFVGAGLLERMETEDELASVLGHEIEHIDHYHCAERLQTEAALRKLPLGDLLGISVEIFQAGYSKDQELEADREGVRLASRAGYAAGDGAIRMFQTFDELMRQADDPAKSPQQEIGRVAADVLSGYFRSHPLPAERIAQIRAMLGREPATAVHERDLAILYIFLTWHSADRIAEEKFDKAVTFANRSLQLKPGYAPALLALTESELGLGNRELAEVAYRNLVDEDLSVAGALHAWTEQFVQKLLGERKYDHGIAVLQTLLKFQAYEPNLLRLLAMAQTGKGDTSGAAVTANNLRLRYPDIAAQFGEETAEQASSLLSAKKFSEASAMAKLSLALDRQKALHTLGDAEFAQARFAEAAAAYQTMLHGVIDDASLLRAYADALGGARPATAVHEFEATVSHIRLLGGGGEVAATETAGLWLMAGESGAAQRVQEKVQNANIPPELLGRLGWWYFRARRMEEAATVLRTAMTLRPNNTETQNNRAWVDLELGKDAFPAFNAMWSTNRQPYPNVGNEPEVGVAMSEWQAGKPDEALREWSIVSHEEPQWLNAAWRNAIYPPHVTQLAAQIEAEKQRREPHWTTLRK